MKTLAGAEHEAMEAISQIADGIVEISNEISSLDLNPKDHNDGMTTPDHLYNISFYLSELVQCVWCVQIPDSQARSWPGSSI